MDFEWHQLSYQSTKFKYKTDSFTQNPMGKRFSKINHEYMMMAVAAHGGPIALTSDKTQILTVREDDPTIENICLYSNEGDLNQIIKLTNPFRNIVVHIEFLQDEMLLVLFQQGQIWLIDPHTGKIQKQQILGMYQTEQVKEAKVFQNGFAFLTNKNRFLFVRNAYQPQGLEFLSCEEQINQAAPSKLFWTVFSPKQIISQKVQLHLCHPVAGIIQVVQQDSKRLFYNRMKNEHVIQSKLPNIKGVTYISELSPNKKMIVYFSAEPIYKQNPVDQMAQNMKKKKQKNQGPTQKQIAGFSYKLIFAPSLTSDSIGSQNFSVFELNFVKRQHLNQNGSPLSINWCGNKAIIIQFWNQDLYMYCVHGDYIRIQKDRSQKNKWSFLRQQIDGTRIITKTENKIMRQIPASYISIFESFSQEPGALLHAAYNAFQQQAPLQDDKIRKQKKKLAIGVEQCLKASRFEIDYNKVMKLMKAATYGKAFLPPNMIANNLIYDTTKILRLVNCLRNKQRYITFEQFESLKDDMILKILLRYREHYLAFEIYQYLKKDPNFRVKIYTDWACCKVQNTNQSEEQICEQIRRKLEDQKGISFTQIAHRAIEVQRSDLALKLLAYEPSLAKKIPLLLWMGSKQKTQQLCIKFYQKALQQALRSRDLNLLFLSIRKSLTSQQIPRQKVFSMLSNHREGRAALLNYFKLFDSKSYIEYNRIFLNDVQAVIMEYLRKAFAEKQYDTYQSLFQCAVQLLKQFQSPVEDDWRKQTIPKIYGHLCQFIKHSPHIRYRNDKVKPVTISRQLDVFLNKKDQGAVDDIKSFYKISDKRVVMAQVKVFIDNQKWEDLESFVQRNQKKFNLPIELIADRVLAKKQQSWGMRLMARMPSKQKDEQYLLLQRIGRIKEAIDLAADRKDIDALEDILPTLRDVNLIAYANEKINLIRRK